MLNLYFQSGFSTLLYPAPLYSAHYHALALHLRPICQVIKKLMQMVVHFKSEKDFF